MSGAIELTPDGKSLVIRFPYREDLVDEVRLIPGRRWDPDARVWKVPVLQVDTVASTFRPHGFAVTPAVAELLGDDVAAAPDNGEPTLPFASATPDSPPALSISALNHRVRQTLQSQLPDPLWVVGEVLDFDRSATRRHIFFQLVEKVEGHDQLAARVEVALFESTWERLSRSLEDRGLTLRDGIEIRALARVDLYPASGRYQIVLEDIDPAFTLGKMALTREAILAELRQRGLDKRNVAIPVPQPPLRVGVMTSLDSEGWNDFQKQLETSGLGFEVTCHAIRVQGPELRPTVLAGLQWFAERRTDFDVLCILRGGGSRSDLAWFDDRDVAMAVALHPVPVVCGIGHQRDQSVLDAIARSQKTPTAVGAWLVDQVRTTVTALERNRRRLAELLAEVMNTEKTRVGRAAATLGQVMRGRVAAERQELTNARQRLRRAASSVLSQERDRRDRDAADLRRNITVVLERAGAKIAALADRQRLLDPARVLERGYALVRDRAGHVIPRAAALREGMELDISLADGHAHATTTRVFGHEKDA